MLSMWAVFSFPPLLTKVWMRLRDSNAALFQEEFLAVCDLLLDAYNEPGAGRFAVKDNLSVLRKLDRLITIIH